jgi:hypothetical protein
MSQLTFLRYKTCACCSIRLDSTLKRNITRVYSENVIQSLNSVKNKILTNKNRPINDTIIKRGDTICGACRTAANNYKITLREPINVPTIPSSSGVTRYIYIYMITHLLYILMCI